ncbi:MAG TPA: PAS domain-containing protein [Kofleriaceae bacterium]|jgi:PAS domain S-box-containing protein|nr:PAS domain-containing protein [Kofleriaceae bacterium]
MRECRDEILAEWKNVARDLPAAKDLTVAALTDHVPAVLDDIVSLAESIVAGAPLRETCEAARRHALDRLAAGFDIDAVVSELSMLRACLQSVWARRCPGESVAGLHALNLAIDRAIEASVARYARARERTLTGIDRISTASLESRDLDDLLQRLLRVFVETTPSVDTAAILLVEGERLRVRAAVGLEDEVEQGVSFAIGEGFAGTIAAERRPIAVRAAYEDPLVRSDVVRTKRVHALYGAPMIQRDRVIGVAHMGSLTANEFAQEDRDFFGSMLARATIGIHHHMLRQQLAESERRYRELAADRERALAKLESLLTASPVGIAFVDRQLRYLRINDALASLNGRPAAEHVGRTIADVLPDLAPSIEPMLLGILETGAPVTNVPVTLPDGRSLLANYFAVRSASGQISGVGGIVLDVSKERRAQEELLVERARVQSILDHAPAAIWVKDPDGVIVLANRRLAEAIGAPLEEVVGHRSEDVFPPDVAAQHNAHDQIVMREHRAIEVEELVPSPHGPRTFLSIKFPIPSNPPLVGGIATEISERKVMEEELRAAVRARDDVLAIVSHDLRTPLGAVQLAVHMLQALSATDHRARRHVEVIHRASQRMEALIEDLLDSENIRAGRLRLHTQPERALAVVSEAVDLQQPSAAEKGIALTLRSELGGDLVSCDRDRMLQVFGNLIGNAIKFCRAGDTITVTAEPDDREIRFSVIDTGPGITAEVLPHVFDAYWSGDEHVKGGSGLGLFISRGIVERHGGRIWVESTPGDGARFFLTLPRAGDPVF